MAEEDESVPDALLPRRPARPGEGRIGEARTRLYGERAGAGTVDGGARWLAVEDRERSAAFARAAVARPSTPEAEAPVEPGGTTTDGEAGSPPDAGPPGDDGAMDPAPDRRTGNADRTRRLILLAVVLVIGVVLGLVIGRSSVAPAVAAPAPAPLSTRMTLIGEVVAVQDGETITVEVGGAPVDVVILGLDTPDPAAPGRPAQCGAGTALAYASDTLAGQAVTLVGDPSVGEFDDRGRRRSYVVLRNQASYTDLALGAGVGRRSADPPAWYDEVFVREEAAARAAGAGIWGAPCRAVL
jgi:micrococcal nuclease